MNTNYKLLFLWVICLAMTSVYGGAYQVPRQRKISSKQYFAPKKSPFAKKAKEIQKQMENQTPPDDGPEVNASDTIDQLIKKYLERNDAQKAKPQAQTKKGQSAAHAQKQKKAPNAADQKMDRKWAFEGWQVGRLTEEELKKQTANLITKDFNKLMKEVDYLIVNYKSLNDESKKKNIADLLRDLESVKNDLKVHQEKFKREQESVSLRSSTQKQAVINDIIGRIDNALTQIEKFISEVKTLQQVVTPGVALIVPTNDTMASTAAFNTYSTNLQKALAPLTFKQLPIVIDNIQKIVDVLDQMMNDMPEDTIKTVSKKAKIKSLRKYLAEYLKKKVSAIPKAEDYIKEPDRIEFYIELVSKLLATTILGIEEKLENGQKVERDEKSELAKKIVTELNSSNHAGKIKSAIQRAQSGGNDLLAATLEGVEAGIHLFIDTLKTEYSIAEPEKPAAGNASQSSITGVPAVRRRLPLF